MKFIKDVARFRKLLSVAEDVFSRGAGIADTLHKCYKEPSAFNVAKTAFDLANQAQSLFLVNYYDFFQGWASPYTDDYNYAIAEILKELPFEERATSDQNFSLRRVTVPTQTGTSVEMYYCINIDSQTVEGIHVQKENLDEAREFIKQQFKKRFQGEFLLMHKKRIHEHGREVGDFLMFDIDDDCEAHSTSRAVKIASKTRKFVDAHIGRSILLYGPPGTGKSTMVRAIVKELGMTSLRIRVEDFDEMSNTTLFEAVKIFSPDCIIIDDLDRIGRVSSILETLERFNKKLKLVFATVNDKEALGSAVLRPGRFDEVIEVSEMESSTLDAILGVDEDPRVREIVKMWPIAYILEYKKRVTYMSREDALRDLAELNTRVAELDDYDTESDRAAAMKKCSEISAKIDEILGVSIGTTPKPKIARRKKKMMV